MSNAEALSFISEARSIQTLPELEARFASVTARFGYDSTTCVLMAEPGKPIQPRVLFGLGDVRRRQDYLDRADFRHDPTFQAVFSRTRAFTWADMEPLARSPASQALFADARRRRHRGLVVPLHGCFGEVTSIVLTGHDARQDAQTAHTLQTCSAVFASQGRRLLDIQEDRLLATGLSRRETQILVWLSRGKTLPELCRILEISIGTAKTHLERAKAKLGEPLTVPSVLEAARRGWLLDPDDFD